MNYKKNSNIILIGTLLLIVISLPLIYKKLSRPRISSINRGDVITFSKNGKEYSNKVLGLPGESILYKDSFYLKSEGAIYKVRENNLPNYKIFILSEELKNNKQKWLAIDKDYVYVIRDSYPQESGWMSYPNSNTITVRRLNFSGGLINKNELINIEQNQNNNNIVLSKYQPPNNKPDKIPNIDLLYPPNITNRKEITAIIKLNLIDQSFINNDFQKIEPYNKFIDKEKFPNNKMNYIYFNPDKTQNIEIKLNNSTINSHGISTTPYASCAIVTDTLEDTSRRPSQNEKECIQKSELSQLIFTNLKLKPGKNYLDITREDTNITKRYEIIYDPKYSEIFDPPDISTETPFNMRYSQNHICSTLKYGNFLSIPFIKSNSKNYYYNLSFPQNASERGVTKNRQVYLKFEETLYEIFLPTFSKFNKLIKTSDDLDLPLDYLVFKDGTKAEPSKMLITDKLQHSKHPYPGIYLELIPFDSTNNPYPNYILPWGTVNSSGCDG